MVLGRADAIVALSEYEAHPVAVMEALTLGIPASAWTRQVLATL